MRLSDRTYKILKWAGLIALPAIATFVSVVLPVWGTSDQLVYGIVTTINAMGVLIGSLIGISSGSSKEDTDEQDRDSDKVDGADSKR